jgi:uncharacterized protein YdaU (DUF1376 family)
MNKPPAFQFYANDWLGSTQIMLMSPAEEGAYIRLLAIAWNDEDCCLPNDDEKLAKLSRLGKKWHSHSGAIIRKCFKVKGNKIFNERLLKEKRKIEDFRKERSKSGKRGAENRWHCHKGKKNKKDSLANGSAMAQPMAKNGSSSSSSSSNIYNIYVQQSKKLGELILKRNPKYKSVLKEQKKNWVNWSDVFRKIAESDERDNKITDYLIWRCQQDPFWRKNICSAGKLREKYDQLLDNYCNEIEEQIRKEREKEEDERYKKQREKEDKEREKFLKKPISEEEKKKRKKMIAEALKSKRV